MGLFYVQKIPNIMGLFYVLWSLNIMGLFYVQSLSYMEPFYVQLVSIHYGIDSKGGRGNFAHGVIPLIPSSSS